MIRIGIIGCGRILAAHLEGYRLLREAGIDDFRITALCARREEDALSYVKRGHGPTQRKPVSTIVGDPLAVQPQYLSDFQDDTDVAIFTDYQQLITDGPVDAINDFTAHSLHHQIAAVALEHGKHLLTQKPLAVTVAAGQQMCEQAEARGLTLGVFENARNKPATRHAHWGFHGGPLGTLQMALIGTVGAWWAPDLIVAETPWRHRMIEAGGLTLDIGVHQANLLRYIAGEIVSVQGQTSILEPSRVRRDEHGQVVERLTCDADDTYFANFTTADGVAGNIVASWGGHGEKTLMGNGLTFYGSQGRVSGDEVTLDDGHSGLLSSLYEAQAGAELRQQHFPHDLNNAFALNQLDWLTAIRENRQPETSGREGLRDLAVAYAILESAQAHRRVEVAEVLSGALAEYQKPINRHFDIA